MKKLKVTFYFKSGNSFVKHFTKFECSKLSNSKGNREMEWAGNKGNFTIDEAFQDKFSKGEENSKVLEINSGTIEMNNNKIIILVD